MTSTDRLEAMSAYRSWVNPDPTIEVPETYIADYIEAKRSAMAGRTGRQQPRRHRRQDIPEARIELEQYLERHYGQVEREFQFHPSRKWRADYALLRGNPPVLIEYDGLMRHNENQGHASIAGILRDAEKGNEAQALGYIFLRANAKSIQDGTFFRVLDKVMDRVLERRT